MILGRITTGRDDPALRFYRTSWQMPRRRLPIAIPQYQARTFYSTRSFSGLGQTPSNLKTIAIVGLLGLGVLGTIVYIAKRW